MTSRSSNRTARELYETKQRALHFYEENKIPERIEKALNSIYFENPDDVYGELCEHFQSFSKLPTISRVVGREALDSKGQPTVQVEVYCIINGKEQHMSTATVCSHNTLSESATADKKEADDKERQQSVEAALEHIKNTIGSMLLEKDPCKQKENDQFLSEEIERIKIEYEEKKRLEREQLGIEDVKEPPKEDLKPPSPKAKKGKGSAKTAPVIYEEPKEPLVPGCSAVSALSQAMAMAAANITRKQLFEHIAQLKNDEVVDSFRMPIPLVNMLNFGRALPGKLNISKEVLVMPKPGRPLKEAVKQIGLLYNQVGKLLFSRLGIGIRNINDLGGFCPAYDRLEQALDVLQEAITSLGLAPSDDFYLAINCAAHEIYDPDKGKYEVTGGVLKGPDEMVEFYSDITNRYPAVVALIDPLRKQEREAWAKLLERIGEKCYLMGDRVHPRTERLVAEGFKEVKSSAVLLKLQNLTTISDTMEAVNFLSGEGLESVISSVSGETTDTLLADLAVGLEVKFLKLGAPCRGERVSQFNRLLQIEQQLEERGGLLQQDGVFNFPSVVPPPITPEPEIPTDEHYTVNGKKK